MSDDLFRVESAITATASGNLTWERWTHDCATALGLSGLSNPLGFAVVRYLSDQPSSVNVWNVVLVLAAEMQKRGVVSDNIKELAFRAFEFWGDSRCSRCGGRGVLSIEQATCGACNGSGHRVAPSSPDPLAIGVSCLINAENWMEGQLASRLKDQQYTPSAEGYKLMLPGNQSAHDVLGCAETRGEDE